MTLGVERADSATVSRSRRPSALRPWPLLLTAVLNLGYGYLTILPIILIGWLASNAVLPSLGWTEVDYMYPRDSESYELFGLVALVLVVGGFLLINSVLQLLLRVRSLTLVLLATVCTVAPYVVVVLLPLR